MKLYEGHDPVGDLLAKWRQRAVAPYLKGKLVDLACGDNQVVRAYGSGIGVDIADYGADVVVKDFSHLPLPDSSADTVTLLASINLLADRSSVFREVSRVLRPGGRFVVTLARPLALKVWHRLRPIPWKNQGYFDSATLCELFENAGFVSVESSTFMLGLNLVYVGTKQLPN